MRLRIILARVGGVIYLILGLANLSGLLLPEVREQVISLTMVIVRYAGFAALGVGLLMLRRWAAYLWAILLAVNFIALYTVYGGQTVELNGLLALLPWVGPVLIAGYFYYLWPVLKPNRCTVNT